VLVRDSFGAAVPGVRIELESIGRDKLLTTSDHEGRAEVLVEADTDYSLGINSRDWRCTTRSSPLIKAGPKVHELVVARPLAIEFSYSTAGIKEPSQVLVAMYGSNRDDYFFFAPVYSNPNQLWILDVVRRLVVLSPGCVPEEVLVSPTGQDPGPPIHVELRPGPTISVSREVLPKESAAPLKATTTATSIAHLPMATHLEQFVRQKIFSSSIKLRDGDIVFGPFTAGTYALKILDATGKTLWEEEREVK
jgi:hypothetical protein